MMTETLAPRWLRPAPMRLVCMLVAFIGVLVLSNVINLAVEGNAVFGLLFGVVTAGLALWFYAVAVRFTERRAVTELEKTGARGVVLSGAGIGLGLFTATILLIAVFGGFSVAGWGSFGGALSFLGLMCATAVTEELLFRGVLFRIVEEMTGTWGALGISAVLFGVIHLLNPGATFWGAIAVAVEAGLMLGSAYIATRSLWLPIGLHLGWNFAASGVFTTITSGGHHSAHGLLDTVMSGPAVLTGGSFGPEGSIFAILVCTVPTVLFLRSARRRGLIRARRVSN